MAKKGSEKKQGDFRYQADEARVPWHAVGEHFSGTDVQAMVEFLMRPKDDAKAYAARLREAQKAIAALAKVSSPATKLTLGATVQKAEEAARALLKVKYACMLNT